MLEKLMVYELLFGEKAMTKTFTRLTVSLLIVTLFTTTSFIPAARALVINTSSYMEMQNNSFRTELQSMLARKDFQDQLVAFGVKPNDAADRIAALTDQELMQLQERMNDLPAGSGALAVIGVVFLVLIVLELVGATNVFSRL